MAVLPECDALTDICHNCLNMVILRTDLTKEVKKGNEAGRARELKSMTLITPL